MKLKNPIVCQNCGAENEYYREKCKECKAYIRARIFNVDLWRTIWYLIESPLKAFKEIIFAEHKNYVVFLLILMGVKYFFNSLIISNFIFHHDSLNETPLTQVFPAIGVFIALLVILSYIFTHILNMAGYRNIFKSVLAVITYTFVPSVLIFAILSPIEFALFGQSWFYNNPSPLVLKQNAAYILYGLEVLVYLWGCVLTVKAFIALTGKRLISYILGIICSVIIAAVMVLLPLIF
jgi:hypothetical protein